MTTTTQNRFLRSDPITYLFRVVLRMPSWAATICYFFLINVPIFIASARTDALFTQGNRIGLLDDYGWWAYQFGTFPATFYAFMWLPDGVMGVIEGLQRNKVIAVEEASGKFDAKLDAFLARFYRFYSNPIWILLAIAFVSTYMVALWLPQQYTFHTWQSASPFAFWYLQGAWFLTYFVGSLLFLKGVFTIYWLNNLFREFNVVVKVLHPDGAGGLSPLGKFSVSIGYVLGIYGIGQVIGAFSAARITGQDFAVFVLTDMVSISIWILYFIIAPLLFFLPLNVAHSGMQEAKDEYTASISNRFDREIEKVQNALDTDGADIKLDLAKIEQLQKLHDIAVKFPVWPFNTGNLVRFTSSILAPVALSLLTIIIDRIIK